MQHNDARFLELLRRWQSGDFTRADEQELNALTASDDFRREAMEGFMSLPEAAHDEQLAALRLRLQRRTGGGRVLALPQILAAAAALVLLIAAIVFFPKWNVKEAAPVAQAPLESPGQIPATEAVPGTGLPDSQDIAGISPDAGSAPAASSPAKPAPQGQTLSAPGAAPDIAAAEEAESIEADDVPSGNAAVAPPQAPVAAPARAQSREMSDKMASESAKDRAAETVLNRPEQFAKAKKSKEAGRPADTAWHETDRKPDMQAEKKAARDQDQQKESEPEGGWEAFSEYLRQNARLTPEARNHNASGTVQLQFNLNANGEPQGFVILRSVGYGCDQEAIRLVRNWEWVRGINPILTVDVPFVR